MPYKFLLLKTIFVALFSFPLYGKMFRAPYVEFDIKYDWTCKSFGVDWVCHHYFNQGSKPSLILITAKEGNRSDDLNFYIQSFNQEKTPDSKTIHIKKIMINRHTWVESFYQDSIFKNMFSRYVATVCCDETEAKIHILIGFHAHKENYVKYSNEFLKSIKSLRLAKNSKKLLKQIRGQTYKQKKDMMSYVEKVLFDSNLEKDIPLRENKRFFAVLDILFAGFILITAAILFYFFYYKKNRKKRSVRYKRRKKPRSNT